MIDNTTLVFYGFVTTYIDKVVWHFTAYRIRGKSLKPYVFKKLGL